MRREAVLNLAISVDGFIAEEDGGFDRITGQGDASLDTEQDYPFPDFLKGVDVVVIIRRFNCVWRSIAFVMAWLRCIIARSNMLAKFTISKKSE